MRLVLLLAISAIGIFVTYASVYGLGVLFKSIMHPVMMVGVALEAGKYVAVSVAYQHWGIMSKIERVFLALFVAVLMAFTSFGVFAYLGYGYQTTFAGFEADKEKINVLKQEAADVQARIQVIEDEMRRVPENVVSMRIRLIKELNKEKEPLVEKLVALNNEIRELTAKQVEAEVHAGPIEYISKVAGVSSSKAATFIIAALTLSLDPFAVFMTILLNKLTLLKRHTTDAGLNEQSPQAHTWYAFTKHLPRLKAASVTEAAKEKPIVDVSSGSAEKTQSPKQEVTGKEDSLYNASAAVAPIVVKRSRKKATAVRALAGTKTLPEGEVETVTDTATPEEETAPPVLNPQKASVEAGWFPVTSATKDLSRA